MKYVVARVLAGIVIVPAVAVAWVLTHAMLIGLGAGQVANASEVFIQGLVLGVFVEFLFVMDLAWKGNKK